MIEATRANSSEDLEFACLRLRLDLVVNEARYVADSPIYHALKWYAKSV